jgi:hypothetical protein
VTFVGYKGLPQGSVLSPFLYNIIGSFADKFNPSVCGFLQYAVLMILGCIWHTDCLMWLVDWFKLLAHRSMFSFLL